MRCGLLRWTRLLLLLLSLILGRMNSAFQTPPPTPGTYCDPGGHQDGWRARENPPSTTHAQRGRDDPGIAEGVRRRRGHRRYLKQQQCGGVSPRAQRRHQNGVPQTGHTGTENGEVQEGDGATLILGRSYFDSCVVPAVRPQNTETSRLGIQFVLRTVMIWGEVAICGGVGCEVRCCYFVVISRSARDLTTAVEMVHTPVLAQARCCIRSHRKMDERDSPACMSAGSRRKRPLGRTTFTQRLSTKTVVRYSALGGFQHSAEMSHETRFLESYSFLRSSQAGSKGSPPPLEDISLFSTGTPPRDMAVA